MDKRPFLWITICFMAGIISHNMWRPAAVEIVAMVSIILLATAYLARRKNYIFVVVVLLNFILLGWFCSHTHWLFSDHDIYFQQRFISEKTARVRGIVVSDIRKTQMFSASRLSFQLNLREIKIGKNWQPCSGKVLVNLFQDLQLHYGDDLVLMGKLHRPYEFSRSEKFSYRKYLQRRGIYFILSVKKDSVVEILQSGQGNPLLSKLKHWRTMNSQVLDGYFSPSEASLMQAMLLGERLHIPQALKDAFAKTGTTHILAISGLNVGIVVAVLFILLKMIPGPRIMPYGLTMIFIGIYVVLTGASASVVRAGIMASVFLTSFVIERESDAINSLAFAAFLLLLINTNNLFDIGFQLSFLSVLTILIFYPLLLEFLQPLFKKYPHKILKFSLESIVLTLSATLGVGGLIAYYFNMVTPISLLANVFVVPLSSAALILGLGMLFCSILGSMGGFGWPVLVPFFGVCIKLILNLMVWTMFFFSQVPWAYFFLKDVNLCQLFAYYLFVLSLWIFLEEMNFRKNFYIKG